MIVEYNDDIGRKLLRMDRDFLFHYKGINSPRQIGPYYFIKIHWFKYDNVRYYMPCNYKTNGEGIWVFGF